MVITSAQLTAVALILLFPVLLLAKLLIFALAAVMLALLTERTAAFAVWAEVEVTQDMMAVMASSSNFLQVPKAVLHLVSCLVMALALLLVLQLLRDWAVVLSIGPTQHPQASDTFVLVEPKDLATQTPVALMKLSTSESQRLTSVVFGWGKLAGLLQWTDVRRI